MVRLSLVYWGHHFCLPHPPPYPERLRGEGLSCSQRQQAVQQTGKAQLGGHELVEPPC